MVGIRSTASARRTRGSWVCIPRLTASSRNTPAKQPFVFDSFICGTAARFRSRDVSAGAMQVAIKRLSMAQAPSVAFCSGSLPSRSARVNMTCRGYRSLHALTLPLRHRANRHRAAAAVTKNIIPVTEDLDWVCGERVHARDKLKFPMHPLARMFPDAEGRNASAVHRPIST